MYCFARAIFRPWKWTIFNTYNFSFVTPTHNISWDRGKKIGGKIFVVNFSGQKMSQARGNSSTFLMQINIYQKTNKLPWGFVDNPAKYFEPAICNFV